MERQEKSKSIIETDERVQVTPMTSPPYKWICHLEIEMVNGDRTRASGFKIRIPDVNLSVVVTSGHCTYDRKFSSYAKTITVTFPGEYPIKVGPHNLYASPEYIQNGEKDHDYGLILLPWPGNCEEGFGWSTVLPDRELNNQVVTVCGFPGDKPNNTMWITERKIQSFSANMIFYETNTFPGEGGSPAYIWHKGYWMVFVVHSYGGIQHNSAPRFTIKMITRFLERMNCLKPKSLMSVAFPDVFIRCDGREVVEPEADGAGTVNCQCTPSLEWESFYIIPVEMRPSSAQELGKTVALESAHFRNVYIRLDGRGMNAFQDPGGGKVNCQARVGMCETFVMKVEPNKGYSFRSVEFPNCYIRMDGRGVTHHDGPGSGIVNCQYYRDFEDVSSWETFFVRDWHGN